jgi:tartrate dehydrogenase/decarboxylase/D-malate dehydrogenase
MMLDHLGERDAADAVLGAIARVLSAGQLLTRDLGGAGSTVQMADAIVAAVGSESATKVR